MTKAEEPRTSPTDDSTPHIELRAHVLLDAFGKRFVHNELVFVLGHDSKKPGDKKVISFNGTAHDPITGAVKNRSYFGQDLLKTVIHPARHPFSDDIHTTTLFSGDKKAVLALYTTALATANEINQRTIPYKMWGIEGEAAQNSNSVIRTLMDAMGLDYPDEFKKKFSSPGYERNLLPPEVIKAARDQLQSPEIMDIFDILSKQSAEDINKEFKNFETPLYQESVINGMKLKNTQSPSVKEKRDPKAAGLSAEFTAAGHSVPPSSPPTAGSSLGAVDPKTPEETPPKTSAPAMEF